jgi:gamma-glutamyltranspeptidase/glutathione hydrolase
MKLRATVSLFVLTSLAYAAAPEPFSATQKPVLHGRHWVAVTGKPPGALAGARMFERGGNAIDAA